MKLKRLFAAVLVAVSMLTMGMMLSGCGGSGDSKEEAASASYTTQDEAVQAATKESQEVVKQIEAREGKVVVIWANTAEDASVPFTLGLVEKDGDSWKVTNTASVTMTDKFSGKGSYPVNDPMITYDVTPEIDDPVAGNHANHEQANDWCIHWTLVPELPA